MEKERADEIREAVRVAVYGPAVADPTREPSTIRAVAREIGMTPSGLMKFLAGSVPYTRTGHRLEQWMDRQGPRGRAKQQARALALLLDRIAPEKREHAEGLVRQLIGEMEAQFPIRVGPRRTA